MKQETIKYLEMELKSLLRIKDFMENGIVSSLKYNKLLKNIGAIIQVLELLKEEVK